MQKFELKQKDFYDRDQLIAAHRLADSKGWVTGYLDGTRNNDNGMGIWEKTKSKIWIGEQDHRLKDVYSWWAMFGVANSLATKQGFPCGYWNGEETWNGKKQQYQILLILKQSVNSKTFQ